MNSHAKPTPSLFWRNALFVFLLFAAPQSNADPEMVKLEPLNDCTLNYTVQIDIRSRRFQTHVGVGELNCRINGAPYRKTVLIEVFGSLPSLQYNESGTISGLGYGLSPKSFLVGILNANPASPKNVHLRKERSNVFLPDSLGGHSASVEIFEWQNRFYSEQFLNQGVFVTVQVGRENSFRPIESESDGTVFGFGTEYWISNWRFRFTGESEYIVLEKSFAFTEQCESKYETGREDAPENTLIYLCAPDALNRLRPIPYDGPKTNFTPE